MTKKHEEEPEDVHAEPIGPEEHESVKEKFTKHVNKEQLDHIYGYAKENTRDVVAYALLFVGLILLFFLPFWGELIVGLVAGFYFSDEILDLVKNANTTIKFQPTVKSIVFAAALISLIILAPMFFVGAGVVAGLKYLFLSEKH